MVVTRYMNGNEITQADLRKIRLTDTPEISQLIGRVVARINKDIDKRNISTKNIPT